MNISFQVGPAQLMIGAVVIIAIWLLFRPRKGNGRPAPSYREYRDYRVDLDEENSRDNRRSWRPGCALFWLVVVGLVLVVIFAVITLQAYAGNELKVAHIKAHQVANSSVPELSVEVTLYAPDGQISSYSTYLIMGNEWLLQGDVIKISPNIALFGLHSGYKLTRLEGRFDDPGLEASSKHSVVTLNGGDDGFFQGVRNLSGFLSPLVQAEYGSGVFQGAGSYDVFASQSSLWTKKTA